MGELISSGELIPSGKAFSSLTRYHNSRWPVDSGITVPAGATSTLVSGRCWESCPAPGSFSSSAPGPARQEQVQESLGRRCVWRRRNKWAPNPTSADRSALSQRVHQRQAGGPVETLCLCLVADVVRVVERARSSLAVCIPNASCLVPLSVPSPLLRCRAARAGRVGRQRERIPHVQR